ncbi:MAG TPA: hypothetical protein VGQ42_15995 [Candidatus Dormibacteraeota bacterium]|jgi:hypothetical protein|nr:hypothetical protein [Candidatus Dormibacteraeota bacterium]
MAQNGLDSTLGLNGGHGQLWINWRTGSQPLATNWNNLPVAECQVTAGVPRCSGLPRTDRLTDLRYLHNLALYRNQHPGDTRYDAQFATWVDVVKSLWSAPHDERGWTYDDLADITRLTGDQWFVQQAAIQAQWYSSTVFHASCKCLYFTGSGHPGGYYRPVDTVEEAAALASEGARTGNQTYVQQAKQALQFVLDHGYLRAWHAFPYAWENVLNADGSVNDNETFASGLPNPGNEVRAIWIAQEAQTLFHASRASGDARWYTLGAELLDSLTPAANSLGLWDSMYGGYCEKVSFSGLSYAAPGAPALACTKKEAGRQLVVLDAARVAAAAGAGSRYDDLIQRMTAIAVGPDYYAAGAGYVYEVSRSYGAFDNHGTVEDWVTGEADGIALEALFALTDKRPW